MAFHPGDVIRVWDRQVRPPKEKRLICLHAENQHFLRINSKPLFPPHHPLRASECDFLEHDSYVELRQLVRPYAYEIQEAILLGRLPKSTATQLIIATDGCDTLTEDQKQIIRETLGTM